MEEQLMIEMQDSRITNEMIEEMRNRIGSRIRIDHSIFNEEATRMAIMKFADGTGVSFFIASFGIMLGPPFFGSLVDLFDSFLWSWLFLAFCMIMVSVLTLRMMTKARNHLASKV